MISYLLDTNVLAEIARPHPDPAVLERLADTEDVSAIAAATWHDLVFGVERVPAGRRRDAMAALLVTLSARYPVVPYDRAAAEWHARERARLQFMGRTPPFVDGQIAATAVTRALRLITRNVAGFAGFGEIQVESWWSADRPGPGTGRP